MKKKIILLIASSLLILSCEEQIFVKDISHTNKTVKQYVFLTFKWKSTDPKLGYLLSRKNMAS
jgi:hypothetical protein